ncbi:hypothetical protein APS_0322 [Acetobacter pasteurianus subsp. pasteurianus LMG 1262 = NBRC 106471]|nr:hypothetical protein APS_0322 [Acetobacter pasteurianus subsp. pasteurianus LMG 1262 = NBRC 106471]
MRITAYINCLFRSLDSRGTIQIQAKILVAFSSLAAQCAQHGSICVD